MPFLGKDFESSGRDRVAEKRWRWLASSNCVWACGGWDWDFERNSEASELAEVELEKRRIVGSMVSVVEIKVGVVKFVSFRPRISRGSGELQ